MRTGALQAAAFLSARQKESEEETAEWGVSTGATRTEGWRQQ